MSKPITRAFHCWGVCHPQNPIVHSIHETRAEAVDTHKTEATAYKVAKVSIFRGWLPSPPEVPEVVPEPVVPRIYCTGKMWFDLEQIVAISAATVGYENWHVYVIGDAEGFLVDAEIASTLCAAWCEYHRQTEESKA